MTAGLLLFGCLGFYRLGSTTFFVDEVTRAWQASLPLPRLLRELGNDIQPPLYMMILRWWSLLWGMSESALRSFSVLVSMAQLAFVWATWRMVGVRGLALRVSILALAVSPAYVDYSRLAFSWPCFALLVSAIVLMLVCLQQRASRWDLAGLTIFSGAALYTNYLAGVITLACALIWIVWRRHFRAPLSWCAVWLLATGLLFLPWLPAFAHQWMNDISDTPTRSLGERGLRLVARVASIGYQFVAGDSANPGQFGISAVALGLAALCVWRGVRVTLAAKVSPVSHDPVPLGRYLAIHGLLFTVCLGTINFLHGELHFMFTAERLLFSLAPLALLFGLGICYGRGRRFLLVSALFLAGLLHWQYYSGNSYYNWAYHTHWNRYRERIAASTAMREGTEPLVIFDNHSFGRVGERYFGQLGHLVNLVDETHREPNRDVAALLTDYSIVICVISARDTSPGHLATEAVQRVAAAGFSQVAELHFLEEPASWCRLKKMLRPDSATLTKVDCRILQRTE